MKATPTECSDTQEMKHCRESEGGSADSVQGRRNMYWLQKEMAVEVTTRDDERCRAGTPREVRHWMRGRTEKGRVG